MVSRLVLFLGWALAPALFVLILAAARGLLERARERRRHASVLEGLGAPVEAPELFGVGQAAPVTLEGTLVVTNDATPGEIVSFHPYGTSFLEEVNAYALTNTPRDASFALD